MLRHSKSTSKLPKAHRLLLAVSPLPATPSFSDFKGLEATVLNARGMSFKESTPTLPRTRPAAWCHAAKRGEKCHQASSETPSVIMLPEQHRDHPIHAQSVPLSALTTGPGCGEGSFSTYLQLEQGICKERRKIEDFKKTCEKQHF